MSVHDAASAEPPLSREDVREGPTTSALTYDFHVGDEKLHGKYPGRGTREDPFVVTWDDNDPENPFNWAKSRKWLVIMQVRHFQLDSSFLLNLADPAIRLAGCRDMDGFVLQQLLHGGPV